MFEHDRKPLIPQAAYHRRLISAAALASMLMGLSLLAGMVGDHLLADLPWVDADLSAAMILSGMGPVGDPSSQAGKVLAGTYALDCGFAALVCGGVMAAPVLHPFLHRFHVEEDADA